MKKEISSKGFSYRGNHFSFRQLADLISKKREVQPW